MTTLTTTTKDVQVLLYFLPAGVSAGLGLGLGLISYPDLTLSLEM